MHADVLFAHSVFEKALAQFSQQRIPFFCSMYIFDVKEIDFAFIAFCSTFFSFALLSLLVSVSVFLQLITAHKNAK